MKKRTAFIFFIFFFLNIINLSAQLRSFNDIFPNASPNLRAEIFSETGYLRSGPRAGGFTLIGSNPGTALTPEITGNVLNRSFGYIAESISVIPMRTSDVRLLDIYNALGNIRSLDGLQTDSDIINRSAPVFRDVTRITSERNTTPLPDPPPARFIPRTEIYHIRVRDVNFGNTFFRSDITLMQNGLRYTLTNFRSITFLFIPVIREENFFAQLYIEPINEGILLYVIGGTDISDFLASNIHVDSAITRRLDVFFFWVKRRLAEINR